MSTLTPEPNPERSDRFKTKEKINPDIQMQPSPGVSSEVAIYLADGERLTWSQMKWGYDGFTPERIRECLTGMGLTLDDLSLKPEGTPLPLLTNDQTRINVLRETFTYLLAHTIVARAQAGDDESLRAKQLDYTFQAAWGWLQQGVQNVRDGESSLLQVIEGRLFELATRVPALGKLVSRYLSGDIVPVSDEETDESDNSEEPPERSWRRASDPFGVRERLITAVRKKLVSSAAAVKPLTPEERAAWDRPAEQIVSEAISKGASTILLSTRWSLNERLMRNEKLVRKVPAWELTLQLLESAGEAGFTRWIIGDDGRSLPHSVTLFSDARLSEAPSTAVLVAGLNRYLQQPFQSDLQVELGLTQADREEYLSVFLTYWRNLWDLKHRYRANVTVAEDLRGLLREEAENLSHGSTKRILIGRADKYWLGEDLLGPYGDTSVYRAVQIVVPKPFNPLTTLNTPLPPKVPVSSVLMCGTLMLTQMQEFAPDTTSRSVGLLMTEKLDQYFAEGRPWIELGLTDSFGDGALPRSLEYLRSENRTDREWRDIWRPQFGMTVVTGEPETEEPDDELIADESPTEVGELSSV